MKRVICLYRVSTVGQVDHDDIPMQRLACREYAKTHPDWEIIDEISEKGISGYKVSATDRDAIVEIKKRAGFPAPMIAYPRRFFREIFRRRPSTTGKRWWK
jgi:hypothetical protein